MDKLYAFITSRYGLAIVAYMAGHMFGGMASDKRCDAERLAGELAVVKADMEASIKAKDISDREAAALKESAALYEGAIHELEARLAKDTNRSACRLSADDAGGLLNINAGER